MESNQNYFQIQISSQKYFPLIAEQKKKAVLSQRLKYCALSKNLLKLPILMCKRGYFFNKDIITSVIEEGLLPAEFRHLTSTEDLREIQIMLNPMRNSEFPLLCPLTNKVLNGSNLFVLNWNCGCLLYEKLMIPLSGIKVSMYSISQRRRKSPSSKCLREKKYKCPNCSQRFALGQLFQLNLQSPRVTAPKKKVQRKARPAETVRLGKRGEREPPKRREISGASFNEYLFNLEFNPARDRRNLNFRNFCKRVKGDKRQMAPEAEIRVCYRGSDDKD